MPIYEFQCQACGVIIEVLQKISDPHLTDCEACGKAEMKKKVTAAAFRLSGAGWYETDFKEGDNKKNLTESDSNKKDQNSANDKSEKSDTKESSTSSDSKSTDKSSEKSITKTDNSSKEKPKTSPTKDTSTD